MGSNDRVWRERGLHAAVLAGDERAWRTWYDESYAPLEAYVLWRCGGLRDLADDVVQETWLTAVRRIRRFDPTRAPFLAWLRGIAVHLLHNQWRRRQRTSAVRPLPESAAAAEDVQKRDRAEAIAHALADLPERYEAVLRAKYLDQKSVREIAEELDQTEKAIESLLTRARQAFREAFGKPDEPDVSIRPSGRTGISILPAPHHEE